VAGVIAGVIAGFAAFTLPLSGRLEGPGSGRWVALGVAQIGAQLDLVGWSMLGLVAALLGMVVAIVAFVGMREAPAGSHRRRALLIDASGYAVVMATALSALACSAILLSVFPSTFLHALSRSGMEAGSAFDDTLIDDATDAAVRLQMSHVLIGFVALGLLGLCRHLDAAVQAWSSDEADQIAAERAVFFARIRRRSRRLKGLLLAAARIRPGGSPRWNVKLVASVIAAGTAITASGVFTVVISAVRYAEGGEPDVWQLFALLSGAALFHALITSSAYLGLRVTLNGGPEASDVSEGRWRAARVFRCAVALGATLVLPSLFCVALLADAPTLQSVGRVAAMIVMLFILPSVLTWFPMRRYSWNEVAVRDLIRSLSASIRDDEENLARLELQHRASGLVLLDGRSLEEALAGRG